jgi:restriction system protein
LTRDKAEVKGMSLISSVKGCIGEVQGTLAAKIRLDFQIYCSINNVTIPTPNGTTQIDHVIVSKYGLFVVETKNIKGWIYGDEKQPQWTLALYGKRYRFQNPLLQNYRHTKALAEFLGIEHSKIHSVVMFWSECEFKTPMPSNVLDRGYSAHIKSKTEVLFTDGEVEQITEAIKSGMLPKGWSTRRQHQNSLKERFSSETACPKCGAELVLRTARKGPNVGKAFYGCSRFPARRYMRAVEAIPKG